MSLAPTVTPGSSPLTRGKLPTGRPAGRRRRLIPAHAGKTDSGNRSWIISRAHPRSRGENTERTKTMKAYRGSSPLTRGKPAARGPAEPRSRLIPAHAGKTTTAPRRLSALWAHPRSRGENSGCECGSPGEWGSSPLTRGKRTRGNAPGSSPGLIPAHAGKTGGPADSGYAPRAHPRSRGENSLTETAQQIDWGSSPLTRGKPPA